MRVTGWVVFFIGCVAAIASSVNSAQLGGSSVSTYWQSEQFQVDVDTDPPTVDGDGNFIPATATYTLSKSPMVGSILIVTFLSSQNYDAATSTIVQGATSDLRKQVVVTLPNYRPFIDGEDVFTISYQTLTP